MSTFTLPGVAAGDAAAFWERARAAHPAIKKPSAAAFAQFVAERLEGPLSALHPEDLYLAAGALAADAAGVRALRALLHERVAAVLAAMRAPATMQEEVEEQLFEKLLTGKARLASYGGRGELAAWLGAAATRTAIELKRLKRYSEDHGGSVRSSAKLVSNDPELQLLQHTQAARFKRALHEAFDALALEDRNLLRLQLADGLTVDELATIFQVHRATAARRAAKARAALLEGVREILRRRYRMSDRSVMSDLRAIGPNLDVSLSRLLRSST